MKPGDPALSPGPFTASLPKTVRNAILMASVLFFLLGTALLPYPGLQNDECLFVQPFYTPTARNFKIRMY
ncbi:MAG TPA: hypothetical protein VGL53_24455, partial [Bryobacteraceae bacterium]